MIYGFIMENCTISDFSYCGFVMREEVDHAKQTGWVIKNLTVDNDDMPSSIGAIQLDTLTEALLEGIEIRHVFANDNEGILDIRNCDNTTVTDSWFHDNVGTMIQASYGSNYCQNLTIRDSTISNCTPRGVWIDKGSVDITISGMLIEGMHGSSGRGVFIGESSRITIRDCVIANNSQYGVYVYSYAQQVDIRDCVISDNGVSTADYGVYLYIFSNNVTVVNSTFTNNNGAGPIYDASHIQAYDGGNNNIWNDSEGGNRWGDWLGPDADFDGFVDVPYDIAGAAGAQDMLPLADSEEIPPEVVITAPGDGAVLTSTDVTVEWGAWDNQTGLDRIEVTVDSDSPVDVGLNTSMDMTLSEGAHTVTVAAYDAMGNDGSDSVSFSITLPTVPGTPTGLTATPMNSSVFLEWNAPSNGGSAITSYHVYRGTDPGSLSEVGTSNGTSYSDGGLVNGMIYHYAISAENSIGEGSQSDVVNVTPANVPGTPTNLAILVNGTSIKLTWEVPEANGPDIDHYNIYRGTTGTLTKIGEATESSFIDSGPVVGTTYRYQVSAVNSIGEGARGGIENITFITPPGVPRDLRAEIGSEGIGLTWSAPSLDGGTAVTGYRIYYRAGPGPLNNNLTVTTLQHLFTDLEAGTTYYFRAVAINEMGPGESTTIINATFVTKPAAPTNIGGTEGAEGITLTWSAPTEDGGLEVISYKIYRSMGDGTMALLATVNGTEFLDTEVQENTTYDYQITAVNSEGEGEVSQQFTITYKPFELTPDEGDAGIPWYIWVIPMVVVLALLLLLFIFWRRRKEGKKEGGKGGERL